MTIAQNFCPNLPLLLLADFFLKSFAEKNRKLLKGSTPRAVYLMMRHEWPGNVRELENVVERAVIMTRYKMITPDEIPGSTKRTGARTKAIFGKSRNPVGH